MGYDNVVDLPYRTQHYHDRYDYRGLRGIVAMRLELLKEGPAFSSDGIHLTEGLEANFL